MDAKEILRVRWSFDSSLLVAIGIWILVVLFNYLAFARGSVIDAIVFYDVGLLFLAGVFIPVYYIRFLRGETLKDIGITKERWRLSILIGLLATIISVGPEFIRRDASGLANLDVLTPLLMLVLVSGFFEAVFFRGFLQLRFERAFGIIPGILLASLMYSLYHIGYPGWATFENIATLFFVGILYAAVFRITKNILNQWPVFIPMGAILDVYLKHGITVQWPEAYGYLIVGIAYLILFTHVFRKS